MSFLSYEYRPEYDERKNSGLCEQAFETLETIIQQGSEQGIVSHSMKDGVVRRQLDVYESGEGEYSHLHTELQLVIEDYRSGPLRRMARLTLNDFISNSPTPLINEYHFESFAGGGVQALVSTTDVIRGEGLDARRMVPYDFKHFDDQKEGMSYAIWQMTDAVTSRKVK